MKRLLVTVLLLASAGGAWAQVVVSNNLGLGFTNSSYTEKGVQAYSSVPLSTRTLSAALRTGYRFLNGLLEAGVEVGGSVCSDSVATGTNNNESAVWEKLSQTVGKDYSTAVAPYVKVRCAEMGQFSMLMQLTAGWEAGRGSRTVTEYLANSYGTKTFDYSTKIRQFSVRLLPVLRYQFGANFEMNLYLDLLSVGYAKAATTTYKCNSEVEQGVLKTSGFTVGLNTTRAALTTVGFSYCF